MELHQYELHVFGVNLGSASERDRRSMRLSQREVRQLLHSMAAAEPTLEAVIVRARNHVEAFVLAPAGTNAVRPWVAHLRRQRPDLLHPQQRSYHYHLAGEAAESHLTRLATGTYAPSEAGDTVSEGIKAALGLAARCGTLGRALDHLFLRALALSLRNNHPTSLDPLAPMALSR